MRHVRDLSVTMRQSHAAGDRLFVDYAGDGVPVVIDRLTGEPRRADLRRGARRIELHLRAGDPAFAGAGSGRRGAPTGSAATSAPSRRSAACRHCWCRTTPGPR